MAVAENTTSSEGDVGIGSEDGIASASVFAGMSGIVTSVTMISVIA
eukprot:CAMPEP_0197668320 /NCGR_PEP_ID=MMETSP1338-20131121/69004_1 /TAXON_ID=43686 ORGANISM="Pelagodinium beii, Strain RCC1491" /NCGR_SAMPLE_ID=MMETSP1338 /ASSEMBLY_ACC=CAM_ASM_000754 /LENGTH=45 /DNA_ID= /DNA_START= /DNA_END= /DNA_ORIENTATION=